MTDFSDVSITLDPLLNQAARFNRICRLYAPLYRQNGVVPGAGGAPTAGKSGFDLGLQDVRDALKYYLEHLNNGRKFVLMGHSQGTGMLTATIAQDVDPKPEVREKMLSALLLGGGVSVPEGAAVGGTFKNIPTCQEPGQTGCVITYVSYSQEVPPSGTSTFGRATESGQTIACTEPAALAGRAGKAYRGSYAARKHVNPGLAPDGIDMLPSDITTPYVVFREMLRGQCKNKDGYSYLEISLDKAKEDKRPAPPYRKPAIEAALGLHLVDYTVELDDLIAAVALQAAKLP
jgi:pimeloyl-ACP methyl ester carboxylesterase